MLPPSQSTRPPSCPPRLWLDAFIWHCVAPSSVVGAAIRTATSLSDSHPRRSTGAPPGCPPAMTRKRLSIPLQSSHLHGGKSSSCTAGVGVDVFESPTRPPRVSLLQRRFKMLQLRCICIFAPHPFCVAKNPRLIAYSVVFFDVVLNGIHESQCTARRPHTTLPCDGAAPLLLARQVRLQHVPLSPIHTRAWCILHSTHDPSTRAAAPHCPRRGYHLPARRYRVQRLTIFRSKPVLSGTGSTSAAETACSLHMPPASCAAVPPSARCSAPPRLLALSIEAFSRSSAPDLHLRVHRRLLLRVAPSCSFRAPRSALRVAVSPLCGGEPYEDSPLSPPTASADYSNRRPILPFSLESHSSASV
ncbi:hypothetical protein B0H13DRAFT_2367991 [Mycena leptocephala]|nr:hypothetical protein B0H13DRAFT_2367991 [Mycena leptocephala]